MQIDSITQVPPPVNETIRNYEPGSVHRESLKRRLDAMARERVEIPLYIGGREVLTGNKRKVVMPHAHQEVVAEFHLAGEKELKDAAKAALDAKRDWEILPWQDRAAVFLKAADLLAGPWRDTLNAATMLGQSKNVFQAEIDAACEFVDFLRYNAHYYQQIISQQPASAPGMWNRLDYRPLEGFVLAITPFNFTAIAANLPAVPALLGNTVVWKASDTQMLSAYWIMKLFKAAGLPDGVINLVAADGPLTSEVLVKHPQLAGVNFTGSTATFHSIWKTVGNAITTYRTYPRLVGETGGKDFIFAHASADPLELATAMSRGAFEYQGQKCSATSRAYIPRSLWGAVQEKLLADVRSFKMGDTRDFSNFINAVIDERSFNKISAYLDEARSHSDARILAGGKADKSKGYFVEPTIIQTERADYRTMCEEIFGPVLTLMVYDERELDRMLEVCDTTSPYALTGAIFARDRAMITKMSAALRNAAGNFYINDKPSGAVVGQQPFGGARASGTNDKAGFYLNLVRWISPRTIKETFVPPKDYRYPFLG